MPTMSFPDWITEFSKPDHVWYVKRLSANDTLANKSHQAGPYIPKEFLFRVLPALHNREIENPRVQVDAFVDSGTEARSVTAIWYNNKLWGGTRNETRVTGWGGSASALLDPDSTGALAVFVFKNGALSSGATAIHVWVCSGYQDEVFEDLVGPVDPGKAMTWRPGGPANLFVTGPVRTSCFLEPSEMPPHWLERFPSGAEIVEAVCRAAGASKRDAGRPTDPSSEVRVRSLQVSRGGSRRAQGCCGLRLTGRVSHPCADGSATPEVPVGAFAGVACARNLS